MQYDLRSDTVTVPCKGMRQAMADAAVGDDVFGEDPTVIALQERVAEVTGKEAALFVPSGTMANQVALMCHTRHGDEVVVGRGSHCAFYESGAGAALSGVQFEQVGSGLFTVEELSAALKPRAYYCPHTSLVVIENTHNRAGGKLFSLELVDELAACARSHDLALHMDGARLWNAAVSLGCSESRVCAPFDTISVCFSKGLGAPIGSAICGSRETIERAIRYRKMLGGGMRQVGVIAAGAMYALTHNRSRVAADHAAAQALAAGLAEVEGVQVGPPESNIVNATVPIEAARVVACAAERGVRFLAIGPHTLRLVTHLDVSEKDFSQCVAATREAFAEALSA